MSGERVQEQNKVTGWTELIIACTLLFRTLQKKEYPGLGCIGITAAWSFGKQSLKYLAVFESQSGTQKK